MKFVLSIFLLQISIISVSSLQCLVCDSADKASCEASQKPSVCEGPCMILKYTEDDGSGERYVYKKGCVDHENQCSGFCRSSSPQTVRSCEASCCTSDNCNKNDSSNGEKRQEEKRSSDSTSNSQRASSKCYFVIGGIVMALAITKRKFVM